MRAELAQSGALTRLVIGGIRVLAVEDKFREYSMITDAFSQCMPN